MSLHRAYLILATGLSALAVLLVGTLVGSVFWLITVSKDLGQAIASVRAVEEIEVQLLTATRLHQLYGETQEKRFMEEAQASEFKLVYWLEVADQVILDPESREVLAGLRLKIEDIRENVLAKPPRIRTIRGSELLAANSDAEALIAKTQHLADQTTAKATRWSRMAMIVAALSIIAIAIILVWVIRYTRKVVYLPVLRLHKALERHAGDSQIRVPERGPLEIAGIAAAINRLIETLAMKREKQLTFLSGIAHDLRNPITTLRTLAQMAVRSATTEQERRLAELVRREADRMNRLVGDLIDVGRVEAGRFELKLEKRDLRDDIRDVCDLYAGTSVHHQLDCKLPPEPIVANHDPMRISQVLGNLVGNAIKYSPGGGEVEVRLLQQSGWALIEVSDEGVGIPREEQTEIFEPFRRGKKTAGEIPGVGLGLSVAMRLVRAHGGKIELESEPGKGSTFRVRLPLEGPKALAHEGAAVP